MTVQLKGAFVVLILALLMIWMISGISRDLEKAKALEATKDMQPVVKVKQVSN